MLLWFFSENDFFSHTVFIIFFLCFLRGWLFSVFFFFCYYDFFWERFFHILLFTRNFFYYVFFSDDIFLVHCCCWSCYFFCCYYDFFQMIFLWTTKLFTYSSPRILFSSYTVIGMYDIFSPKLLIKIFLGNFFHFL